MYIATYKCRLCGQIESQALLGGIKLPYMSTQKTYENTPVKAHYCEDGSLGVMDFCGYKKVGDT